VGHCRSSAAMRIGVSNTGQSVPAKNAKIVASTPTGSASMKKVLCKHSSTRAERAVCTMSVGMSQHNALGRAAAFCGLRLHERLETLIDSRGTCGLYNVRRHVTA
jgi:hypothetical protein